MTVRMISSVSTEVGTRVLGAKLSVAMGGSLDYGELDRRPVDPGEYGGGGGPDVSIHGAGRCGTVRQAKRCAGRGRCANVE